MSFNSPPLRFRPFSKTRYARSVFSLRRGIWAILMLCLFPASESAQTTESPTPQPNTQTSIASKPANPAAEASPAKVGWTDVEAIIPIVGFSFQVLALAFVFFQLRQLKQSIQGETHSKLYDHYLRVTELLWREKHLRPYFYSAKLLEESAPDGLRAEVDMMSEVIAGLLEHAAVQEKNLPKDSWEACWRAFTYERLAKSKELQNYFYENQEWYAQAFCKVVGAKYPNLIKPVLTKAAVRREGNS